MWIAPGIRPSVHSSSSRTSTTSGALGRVEQLARLRDVDLVDLRLDLLEIFAVVRHRFRKCSDPVRGYARSVATEARPLVAVRNRRVVVIVALAALIAAAAVVGVTLLQTRGERTTVPARW